MRGAPCSWLLRLISHTLGASSGIGLATSKLFISKGATVVGADLQEPPEGVEFSFIRTDVTSWEALETLFSKVYEEYGRIDIVYANAGVGPRVDYLTLEKDKEGRLIEPSKRVLDINLIAVTNQVALAVHYMKNKEGGNIVFTASCTGYQRFVAPDYVVAKHGVIGLLRTMYPQLDSNKIRINAVAPSFTRTVSIWLEKMTNCHVSMRMGGWSFSPFTC